MKRSVTKLFWLLLASASLAFGVSLTASASALPSDAIPMHCGSCGTGDDEDHDDEEKEDEQEDDKDKKDKKKEKKPE